VENLVWAFTQRFVGVPVSRLTLLGAVFSFLVVGAGPKLRGEFKGSSEHFEHVELAMVVMMEWFRPRDVVLLFNWSFMVPLIHMKHFTE
jgi:hypothetical protein